MTRIALLGLGRMGTAIGRRLLATGHTLTVWNRTAAKADPLVATGATSAATPAEAVRDADIVITMLADPVAVEAVVGEASMALQPGAVLVEMSTIGPDAVAAVAKHLPDGVAMVDAPVLGSVPAATNGELTILAGGATRPVRGDLAPTEGGEPAPGGADAAVLDVLGALGRVVECGELGRGAALKLVVMTGVVGGVALVGEALAVAAGLGVPRKQALEVLSAGPLAALVGRATATGSDYPIALAAKDLALATDVAEIPVAAAAHDKLRALAAAGAASEDLAALGRESLGEKS